MPPIALEAQGRVSVPAAVRRRLGVGPGAVLACDDEGGGHLILAETTCVLSTVYDLSSAAIATAVDMLLNHGQLTIQDADVAAAAPTHYRNRPRVDFSDCLVLGIARKAGHLRVGTFDRQPARLDGTQKL